MLTIDFAHFPVDAANRVLDLGCEDGRHSLAVASRGGRVIALDRDALALKTLATKVKGNVLPVLGDGVRLPLADGAVDRIVLTEVLEHLPDDRAVLREAARVLAPGGLIAVSVPRWLPEQVCWLLSKAYHQVEGGHVRIYRRRQLLARLREAGLRPYAGHYAHGLHVPYWWLKCLVGVDRETRAVRRYHDLLVHEITHGPWPNARVAGVLDAVIGKSLVLYARK